MDLAVHACSAATVMSICHPMDCSLPGASVHGILQARLLEWVPCSPPGDLPDSGIELTSLALQADSLLLSHQGSPDPAVSNLNQTWERRGNNYDISLCWYIFTVFLA